MPMRPNHCASWSGRGRLPADAAAARRRAPTLLLPHPDPATVLQQLWEAEVRSVLLEGGPRLAGAFLAADLVDAIVWFTAPQLLGVGRHGPAGLGIETLADARRFVVRSARTVGQDVRIDMTREG